MDQALDALLELDERAVVGQADHLATDALANGIALVDAEPRIVGVLLETEADTLAIGIVLQHLDVDRLAHVEHLRGVVDPRPRHVGDVKQPVDAAQIDERAVIGDVLDHAFDDHAGLELRQGLALEGLALLLEQGTAAEHDVAALLVELDDLEVESLADVLLEVAHGAQIHLGAGQERFDADVDSQAALDASGDQALDELFVLAGLCDLIPDLQAVGLLLGDFHQAGLVLKALDVDLHDLARLDADVAIGIGELHRGDLTLGFVLDVDDDEVFVHRQNGARDNLAFDDLLTFFPFQERGFEVSIVLWEHLLICRHALCSARFRPAPCG